MKKLFSILLLILVLCFSTIGTFADGDTGQVGKYCSESSEEGCQTNNSQSANAQSDEHDDPVLCAVLTVFGLH